jgi:regulation of enolase protein 1 (concanavalin A-like superfamily)
MMLKQDSYPVLENTLSKLLNKTEKDWGYLQIHKVENAYAVRLSGTTDTILRFQSNENTRSYRLFWYRRPTPSVSIQSRTTKNKVLDPKTKSYKTKKYKTYQVCCKAEANPLESSINRIFAELVRAQLVEVIRARIDELNRTNQIETEDTLESPVVTVVQQ